MHEYVEELQVMDFTFQNQPIRDKFLSANQRSSSREPMRALEIRDSSSQILLQLHVEELQVMDFEFQNRPMREEHLLRLKFSHSTNQRKRFSTNEKALLQD